MTDVIEATPLIPYALYRWFDAAGRLLYIGKTGELGQRTSGHIARSAWMQLAASSTIDRHGTPEDVAHAEREAIEAEHPLFNKQHNDTPEAKARLRAYLEEIGRLDLLRPATPASLARRAEPAATNAVLQPRSVRLEPFDQDHTEEFAAECAARRERWERWARRSWWLPLWEAHGEVLEDMADMICPSRDVTEAIGCCLTARRRGQNWPMVWATGYLTGVNDYDYAWSAHVDFSFGDDERPPGIWPEELAALKEFADALIEAGRCSSARLGEQAILSGFRSETEAQFAGMAARGDAATLRRCAARLRGGPDPLVIRESRIGALLTQLGELADRDALLSRLEELLPDQRTLDNTSNRRPAA